MMRPDRDLYVKILLENVQEGSERNFLKKGTDLYSTRDTPFDYDSIMIYGPTDYGRLDSAGQRMTTIQPIMPGIEIRYYLIKSIKTVHRVHKVVTAAPKTTLEMNIVAKLFAVDLDQKQTSPWWIR